MRRFPSRISGNDIIFSELLVLGRSPMDDYSGRLNILALVSAALLLSVVAIFSAAIPGTLLAWWGTSFLGLSGIPLALVTVVAGMVLSVAFFAGMIALGRALKFIK